MSKKKNQYGALRVRSRAVVLEIYFRNNIGPGVTEDMGDAGVLILNYGPPSAVNIERE